MKQSSAETAPADAPHPDPGHRPPARKAWAIGAFVVAVAGLSFFQGYRMGEPPAATVGFEAGAVVASGELENALYDPSPRAREQGPRAGPPFTNATGESCRRFVDGSLRGVACRSLGDWRIVELRQEPLPQP